MFVTRRLCLIFVPIYLLSIVLGAFFTANLGSQAAPPPRPVPAAKPALPSKPQTPSPASKTPMTRSAPSPRLPESLPSRAHHGYAGPSHTTPHPRLETHEHPASTLLDLFKNDDEFLQEHSQEYFKKFLHKQTPQVTLLTCADSRVHGTLLRKDPNNYLFTVRNIGNQMQTAMGSVDYGVFHLKTPFLVILGHTHCGAIHAALHPYEKETFAVIRELDHLFTPLKALVQSTRYSNDERWVYGVLRNVDYQVSLAVRRYPHQIKSKKLFILGMIDDLDNTFGKGYGRLLLVNINGERRLEALQQHELVKQCTSHIKSAHIVRLARPSGRKQ